MSPGGVKEKENVCLNAKKHLSVARKTPSSFNSENWEFPEPNIGHYLIPKQKSLLTNQFASFARLHRRAMSRAINVLIKSPLTRN